MTPEEKQLLLKDLCARLPYGVNCSCTWSHEVPNGTTGCVQELSTFLIDEIEIMDNPEYDCQICDVKPYLRPMLSMTEEEETLFRCELPAIAKTDAQLVAMRMELFLKGHLDFNHLIEKGLALEAPEGMYNIE